MKTGILLLAVVLCGCSHARLDGAYARHVATVNELHDKELVPVDAPFVTADLTTPEGKAAFAKAKGIPASSKQLTQEINKAGFIRIQQRYKGVNIQQVIKRCDANPGECSKPLQFERWAREAHNADVERSRSAKLSRLQQWKDERETQMDEYVDVSMPDLY